MTDKVLGFRVIIEHPTFSGFLKEFLERARQYPDAIIEKDSASFYERAGMSMYGAVLTDNTKRGKAKMSEEEIKVIFLIKKEYPFDGVTSPNFIGFVRGLARCYRVGISNYEGEENPKYPNYYCVPVLIPKKSFVFTIALTPASNFSCLLNSLAPYLDNL